MTGKDPKPYFRFPYGDRNASTIEIVNSLEYAPDDHSILDADALPSIISGLRAKGFAFVTLDALLTR